MSKCGLCGNLSMKGRSVTFEPRSKQYMCHRCAMSHISYLSAQLDKDRLIERRLKAKEAENEELRKELDTLKRLLCRINHTAEDMSTRDEDINMEIMELTQGWESYAREHQEGSAVGKGEK